MMILNRTEVTMSKMQYVIMVIQTIRSVVFPCSRNSASNSSGDSPMTPNALDGQASTMAPLKMITKCAYVWSVRPR